ncbi:NAD(P)-binding protein [Clavulina sp. PMI_390]|nr:NAD(P)-binding protein [Clavulina sp. PMI_390]
MNEVVLDVKKEAPEVEIRPVVADFGELASVRTAAETIQAFPEQFHVFFANAATGNPETLHRTSDGFELNFGVDHVAHFLLVNLLLRAGKLVSFSPESPLRIVTVSSRIHAVIGVRLDDPNFQLRPDDYNPLASYSQAKAANLMFARALMKRGILTFAVHPGTVLTNIIGPGTVKHFQKNGWMDADGKPIDTPEVKWKSPEEAAAGYIVAAFDPELKGQSGSYLVDCQLRNELIAVHSRDEEKVEKLWTLSEELVKEQFSMLF